MSDKMREFVAEVKQLCKDFSDQRDRPYMGDVHAALDGLYEQWQAAQSAAVPVVGEPVAWRWIRVSTGKPDGGRFFDGTPSDSAIETAANSYIPCAPQLLVVQPTTSITAAELERLQRNDARYMWVRDVKNDESATRLLSFNCDTNLDAANDAAIAGEEKCAATYTGPSSTACDDQLSAGVGEDM